MVRKNDEEDYIQEAVEAAQEEARIAKTPISANELGHLHFRLEAAEAGLEDAKRQTKTAKLGVDEAAYELRKGLRRVKNNHDFHNEEAEPDTNMRMYPATR